MYHFRDQILRGNPNSFFVFNSDVHCDFPLQEMLTFHEEKTSGRGHVILGSGANSKQAGNYGVIGQNEETQEVLYTIMSSSILH